MDKEAIKARLVELRKDLEQEQARFNQAQANGNAIVGAIQECEHWLSIIKDQSNVD